MHVAEVVVVAPEPLEKIPQIYFFSIFAASASVFLSSQALIYEVSIFKEVDLRWVSNLVGVFCFQGIYIFQTEVFMYLILDIFAELFWSLLLDQIVNVILFWLCFLELENDSI